jgi:hypothetical protein
MCYLANGTFINEALDWNNSGYRENRLIYRETHATGNAALNCVARVEMTFQYNEIVGN